MPANPHNNPELERRLLSCMFFGPSDVFLAVSLGITTDIFYGEKHKLLWDAFLACASEDKSTQPIVVWRRLTGITGDDIPITAEDFSAIRKLEPTTARLRTLVADVLGLWRQRRLCASLRAALAKGEANAACWDDVWEAVEPDLRAAQMVTEDNTPRTLEALAASANELILHGDQRGVIQSGVDEWDRVAGTPRAGELIVIAGRPGTGKTSLAMQMAYVNAREHAGISAVFSLEMTGEELVVRLAALSSGKDGIFDRAVRAPHALAIGKMKNLEIYDGRESSSVAQIEARCRLLSARPNGLRLVVVDYLQLVAPPSEAKDENREQKVAAMSRRFKALATTLRCPVVVLAQLNRESEKDSRRPRFSDLRESGAIEQDADRIWFLYPETDGTPYAEDAAEIPVNLYQAKCRNGKPGIATVLNFMRPIFNFTKK